MKTLKALLLTLIILFMAQRSASSKPKYGDPIDDYKGVVAYCNGTAGNLTGEYQCVEFVKRFYRQTYAISLGPVGTANKALAIWGSSDDFDALTNGSQTWPVADDILCFKGGVAGHVAIITKVNATSIEVIEQNFSATKCRATIEVDSADGYNISDRGKYEVQGWLHLKANQTAKEELITFSKPQAQKVEKPKPKSLGDKIKDFFGRIRLPKIKLPEALNPALGKAKAQEDNDTDTDIPTKVHFSDGMKILIGCTPSEVIKAIGRNPDDTQKLGSTVAPLRFLWRYNNYPTVGFVTDIHFWQYESGRNSEWNNPPKYVHWLSSYRTNDSLKLRPSQIVPSSILNRTPEEICYINYADEKALAIIWNVDGRLYFLRVGDSRRSLFNQAKRLNSKGEIEPIWLLNNNGRAFRNCDMVTAFTCVDHIPQIFDKPVGFGVHDPKRGDVNTVGLGCFFTKFD